MAVPAKAPRRFKSPLHKTVSLFATDVWNDSCSIEELTYAIEHGAVGATTNPTIVGDVLKKEMHLWRERIEQLVIGNPTWTEDEVTWRLIEEMAVKGAELLLPVFEREKGRKGRLSIQTNPKLYRDSARITEQALYFGTLAPNIQVKIPGSSAGIEAIEDVTAAGISVNATVCFSVPQALAVGAAVERGLQRREAAGEDCSTMAPVCTIMVGRLDDWLGLLVNRDGISATPGVVNWAGIACLKRAYGIYQAHGYRARLLSAAYRSHLHWSELIGGNIVMTIPSAWQKIFNASDIQVRDRMYEPVRANILEELQRLFPDFCRAYEPEGMTIADFDAFPPTARTLRQFIASYQDLAATVRDFMLPNPDTDHA
jgi:transaldolase